MFVIGDTTFISKEDNMSTFNLIATAPFGLESLVARELKDLGYNEQKVENNQVLFKGDERAVARTNIWLRNAGKVLLQIGQFEARSFEELFQGTKALPWSDWFPENAQFPVVGKSVKSTLYSVPDCQAIVKKAIVEKMKERYKIQWFEETGPRFTVRVSILKDVVTLTIDTSGPSLHRRGYRTLVGQAPLKENFAASLVTISRWRPDRLLIDPFCGTGTIPIEAAMIGLNMAPGQHREFSSEMWPFIPQKCWQETREEALDLIVKDSDMQIIGFDIDGKVLKLARFHAEKAGVSKYIHFQEQPVSKLHTSKKYGYLICNPPYGERLEEIQQVEKIYRELGQIYKTMNTWSMYVLTSYPRFEKVIGKKADKNRKLYNGTLLCYYYQYFGPRPTKIIDRTEKNTIDT